MSRALDLSLKFGARKIPVGTDTCPATYSMTAGMVEAFYHAARAEALMEAVEACAELRWEWSRLKVGATDGRYDMMEEAATVCEDAIRAMADRPSPA